MEILAYTHGGVRKVAWRYMRVNQMAFDSSKPTALSDLFDNAKSAPLDEMLGPETSR